MRVLLTTLFLAELCFGQSFQLLYYYPEGLSSTQDGIWIVDSETDDGTQVWGAAENGNIQFCRFSPDGRRIAFQRNNNLYIMNNDGSGVRQVTTETFSPDRTTFSYTTNGIFWCQGGKVRRLVEETGQVSEIYDFGKVTKGIWTSRDGTRLFSWVEEIDVDSVGKNPYLTFSPDFSTVDKLLKRLWGHGNLVTGDGQYLLTVDWSPEPDHQYLGVTRWSDLVKERSIYNQLPDGDPMGPSTHALIQVANTDEYIGFTRGMWGIDYSEERVYAWKWSAEEAPILMPRPAGTTCGSMWQGALPLPEGTISVARPTVSLTPSAATDTVTVTAGSSVGDYAATVDSAASDWLTASLSATTGVALLTVTADPAHAPSTSTSATVRIATPDDSISTTLTVQYAVSGPILITPTDLNVTVTGDSGYDVRITWTDASTGETGYAVHRKLEGGLWTSVTTVGEDETSYVDHGLAPGQYSFRVRAVAGSSTSDWSSEATLTVSGYPWVRFADLPVAVEPGDTVLFSWDLHLVYDIQIEYSVDQGETWLAVTTGGAVDSSDDHWQAYPWVVPSVAVDSVLVVIHPYQETSPSQVVALSVAQSSGTKPSRVRAVAGSPGIRYVSAGVLRLDGLGGALRVLSACGRTVHEEHVVPGQRTAHLPVLPPGLYIAELTRRAVCYRTRFMTGTR